MITQKIDKVSLFPQKPSTTRSTMPSLTHDATPGKSSKNSFSSCTALFTYRKHLHSEMLSTSSNKKIFFPHWSERNQLKFNYRTISRLLLGFGSSANEAIDFWERARVCEFQLESSFPLPFLHSERAGGGEKGQVSTFVLLKSGFHQIIIITISLSMAGSIVFYRPRRWAWPNVFTSRRDMGHGSERQRKKIMKLNLVDLLSMFRVMMLLYVFNIGSPSSFLLLLLPVSWSSRPSPGVSLSAPSARPTLSGQQ